MRRNFWRRHLFWTCRSLIPRPPLDLGRRTRSQGALQAAPEHFLSPVQRKALRLASIMSVAPLGRRIEHME